MRPFGASTPPAHLPQRPPTAATKEVVCSSVSIESTASDAYGIAKILPLGARTPPYHLQGPVPTKPNIMRARVSGSISRTPLASKGIAYTIPLRPSTPSTHLRLPSDAITPHVVAVRVFGSISSTDSAAYGMPMILPDLVSTPPIHLSSPQLSWPRHSSAPAARPRLPKVVTVREVGSISSTCVAFVGIPYTLVPSGPSTAPRHPPRLGPPIGACLPP